MKTRKQKLTKAQKLRQTLDSYSAMKTTTIVFGQVGNVLALVKQYGAIERTTRYGDGQVCKGPLSYFEGGFDDYDGSLAWAEVHAVIDGSSKRFCPRTGEWMTGIRV